jgi:hypothetical protein
MTHVFVRRGGFIMLRKDTVYLLSQDTDSKVPKTAVIKEQVGLFKRRIAGSVRLSTGRVLGSDAHEIITNRDRAATK